MHSVLAPWREILDAHKWHPQYWPPQGAQLSMVPLAPKALKGVSRNKAIGADCWQKRRWLPMTRRGRRLSSGVGNECNCTVQYSWSAFGEIGIHGRVHKLGIR
eukprot:6469287-Amphidinium_carterae.1